LKVCRFLRVRRQQMLAAPARLRLNIHVSPAEIPLYRLQQQQITSHFSRTPVEVVAALGAMQAQDYVGALWSVGLRLPGATEAMVEQAFAERSIVRTWPMRGTLHFVAAADVHWMLQLLTPRIIAGSASRARNLELDAAVFARCEKIFVRALQGGRQLTREAMLELLAANKIHTASQRGYHILWRLAQEGVIIFAARTGKSHTFALLEEWVPPVKKFDRTAALSELARRYFTSHGPALLSDFTGWSGLKTSDARMGIEGAAADLRHEKIKDEDFWMSATATVCATKAMEAHLLLGFDEYLLGYKDRSAVLAKQYAQRIVPGSNGMFLPTVVINGHVAGTWKRALKKKTVIITLHCFTPLKKPAKQAVLARAEQYGRFIGLPVETIF
jgi:Winged helix DNA-binding domain